MKEDISKNFKNKYDYIKLENQLCFPLYACAKGVISQYRKPLEKINLTYTQYIVMMVLWEFETITEKELGKKVYLDSGTLAPLLKKLEKQGLINRQRNKDNERILVLTLTDKGKKLKDKALDVPAAMQGCVNLSVTEMKTLRKLLNKAIRKFEEK